MSGRHSVWRPLSWKRDRAADLRASARAVSSAGMRGWRAACELRGGRGAVPMADHVASVAMRAPTRRAAGSPRERGKPADEACKKSAPRTPDLSSPDK